jgi:hypothetical protein
MVRYNQCKNFKEMNNNLDKLIDVLNHRVTKLEIHVKWLKNLIGYVAVILTGMAVKIICFT